MESSLSCNDAMFFFNSAFVYCFIACCAVVPKTALPPKEVPPLGIANKAVRILAGSVTISTPISFIIPNLSFQLPMSALLNLSLTYA